MDERNIPLATPITHYQSLRREIMNIQLKFSENAVPGGGGHETWFYGSAAVEQAAAFSVRDKALEFIQKNNVPRDERDFRRLIENLLEYMTTLQFGDVEWCSGLSGDVGGWKQHYRAPTIAAIEAMRLSIIALLRNMLMDVDRVNTY
jgi:hypothetical protein